MLYNAKNGCVATEKAETDYICFGSGEKNLIMIPGVGDALKTVKGMALPFAFMYKSLAKKFRVYVFSRRRNLPDGFSNEDMAEDLSEAMKKLGIERACVLGVSQGGMIAQFLAANHPEQVERLALAVTLCEPNETLDSVVSGWIGMAQRGDYKEIMLDTAERSYSEKYLKKARRMYSVLGSVGKPKSFDRFIAMAHACMAHNSVDRLTDIKCPTLVIGGREDKIVTGKASEQLHSLIGGSRLVMYDGLGHGAYEEAKDFIDTVSDFFS